MKKKFLYISTLFVIVLAAVGMKSFSEVNETEHVLADEASDFEVTDGNISELAMAGVPEKMKDTAVQKYGLTSKGDINKTKFNIKVKTNKKRQEELDVSTQGSIMVADKKLNFKANGLLQEHTDPDSGKQYLYGMLSAEPTNNAVDVLKTSEHQTLDLLLVFDKNNTEDYYAAISYGIDTEVGVVIYGNAELNREFNLSLQENTDEEVYQ